MPVDEKSNGIAKPSCAVPWRLCASNHLGEPPQCFQVLDFIQPTLSIVNKLGISYKTRRQYITTILGKLHIVALFLPSNHHHSPLHAFHPVCLTVVSHQNLLYIGFSVEYLSAKLDIGNDAIVSVLLQGSAAQLQLGTKFLVRQKTFTAKHRSIVLGGAFKILNHSVEVAYDVAHPLAASCHYFITHSCLISCDNTYLSSCPLPCLR